MVITECFVLRRPQLRQTTLFVSVRDSRLLHTGEVAVRSRDLSARWVLFRDGSVDEGFGTVVGYAAGRVRKLSSLFRMVIGKLVPLDPRVAWYSLNHQLIAAVVQEPLNLSQLVVQTAQCDA